MNRPSGDTRLATSIESNGRSADVSNGGSNGGLNGHYADISAARYDRSWFVRDPRVVARELLGAWLFAGTGSELCGGRIIETEAYLASGDTACHASRGRTPKNEKMFGPPGMAYVYAIHAKWCFNVVTEPEGIASAVLIRAVEPKLGQSLMLQRRGCVREIDLTRGPSRLCQAFGIDKRLNGWDLTCGTTLWLAPGDSKPLDEDEYCQSPRIGVTSAQDLLLRYFVRNSKLVSRRR